MLHFGYQRIIGIPTEECISCPLRLGKRDPIIFHSIFYGIRIRRPFHIVIGNRILHCRPVGKQRRILHYIPNSETLTFTIGEQSTVFCFPPIKFISIAYRNCKFKIRVICDRRNSYRTAFIAVKCYIIRICTPNGRKRHVTYDEIIFDVPINAIILPTAKCIARLFRRFKRRFAILFYFLRYIGIPIIELIRHRINRTPANFDNILLLMQTVAGHDIDIICIVPYHKGYGCRRNFCLSSYIRRNAPFCVGAYGNCFR